MNILKIAAFSDGDSGGNPAGVVIQPSLPSEGDAKHCRQASPKPYLPCHRARAGGCAIFHQKQKFHFAATPPLHWEQRWPCNTAMGIFPATESGQYQRQWPIPGRTAQCRPAIATDAQYCCTDSLLQEALDLFGLSADQLCPKLPPALIHAGADHLLLAVQERATLSAMRYSLAAGRDLMRRAGLTTILLLWAEGQQRFHSRNAFAAGGVYEDPATGSHGRSCRLSARYWLGAWRPYRGDTR
jgi:predicted PhzF superfamily epimerase YddE/YHI9